MKKYVKPALFCERFQLTEMIAGNCNVILNSADISNCAGSVVQDKFSSPAAASVFNQAGDCFLYLLANETQCTSVDSYCYWNGSATYITFNS